VGVPPSAEEAIATLVNIAQLDRAEDKIESLPRVIAASIGRDINDIYRGNNKGVLSEVELNDQITLAANVFLWTDGYIQNDLTAVVGKRS